MTFIIRIRPVNGEANDGSWRRPALAVLFCLAARFEPRVSTLFRVALAKLSAIGERIRVEDPRRIFTLFDFRHVGLRVPDAAIIGLGVVQILILQEPGDAVGLLNITMAVVDVGRRILEARAVAL